MRLWLLTGAHQRALICARHIQRRCPVDVQALATEAHVLAGLNQQREALPLQLRVVELTPQDAGAWFNLGFLAEAIGDLEQAEQAFGRALALNARLDRAWYGLAVTHMKAGRHEQARQALEENTRLQPMSPYGWYQLAHVHVRLSQPAEARRVLDHLRGFEPAVARQLERELPQLGQIR
jgi:tetratricopeptide (TPR) repeat protein